MGLHRCAAPSKWLGRHVLTGIRTFPYPPSCGRYFLDHVLPFRPEKISDQSLFATGHLCAVEAYVKSRTDPL